MTSQVLSIERGSLEQLAALLLERAGLKITPDGYYGLRLALQARMAAAGEAEPVIEAAPPRTVPQRTGTIDEVRERYRG